jgi:hypothetical protein
LAERSALRLCREAFSLLEHERQER